LTLLPKIEKDASQKDLASDFSLVPPSQSHAKAAERSRISFQDSGSKRLSARLHRGAVKQHPSWPHRHHL